MGAHRSSGSAEKYGDVTMSFYCEEQLEAARRMTAIEYLQKYQPYRLKKSSARNEWELTDHDSFKINGITSKWHWKSRDIGGTSALNFLIKVDGMEFKEAVELLLGETSSYIPPSKEKEKPPFVLPERYQNCGRIQNYLNKRGISDKVIRYCRKRGILYESAPYHNAVFVGMDEERKPGYAFLRGIYDKDGKSFRIEQAGSEKKYGFCIPPVRESSRVAVYEACIDALAHMTLEGGRADKYRLALGGISAPKEGETRKQGKNPPALEHFLSRHPEIREIEICTDNDFAGRWACGQIKRIYQERYHIIENLPQIEGEDYGDVAAREAEHKKSMQQKYGGER